MDQAASGFVLTVSKKKSRAGTMGATAAVLYSATVGCFLSMLGMTSFAQILAALVPGLIVVLSLVLLNRGSIRIAAAVIAASIFALLIIDRADGLMQLCNRLFAMSEARQPYVYVFFATSDSEGRLFFAVTLLSAAMGALCHIAGSLKGKMPAFALLLTIVGVQIFFGVFPEDVANVFLFAVFMAVFTQRGGMRLVALPASAMLALLIVSLVLPGASPKLADISEQIRDRLDTRMEAFIGAANSGDALDADATGAGRRQETEDVLLREGDNANASDAVRFETVYEPTFAGAQAGMASPVLQSGAALLLIFLLLFSILVVRYLLRMRRHRKKLVFFDIGPCAKAIDAMFRHVIEWLAAYGNLPEGVPFGEYDEPLKAVMPWASDGEYREMLLLWESAVYGDHELPEEARKAMRGFVDLTVAEIRRRAGRRARAMMRLYLYP